jgi:hypothetical protein
MDRAVFFNKKVALLAGLEPTLIQLCAFCLEDRANTRA